MAKGDSIASAAGSIAARRAVVAAAAKIGATAVAGPLGGVAAAAGSKVVTFINNHKGDLTKAGLAGLAALGLMGTGIANAVGGGLAALGSSIVISILAIPIVVAFFLTIINNTALMVPPSTSLFTGGQGVAAEACFELTQNWSDADKAIELDAISALAQAKFYMGKLCAGGTITVDYSSIDTGYGGETFASTRPGYILIYPDGVGSVRNALYTLSHESGHILQQRTTIDDRFYDDPASTEGFICTYPLSYSTFEDFAEMIALYYQQNPVSDYREFTCMGGQTFPERYPAHWEFARQYIFEENLGWQ